MTREEVIEEAIEGFKDALDNLELNEDAYISSIWIETAIEALTAEAERKRGKWYKPTGMMPPEYTGVYRCSECDGFAMRDWKHHKQTLTNYCPNCGADLREVEE